MIKRLIILLITLIWTLVSCQSPTDIDTPRNKILPTPIDSIQLSFVSMTIETNGDLEQFTLSRAMVEVDTNSTNPLVWGSIDIQSNYIINFSKQKLQLSGLSLILDNIKVSGEPILISTNNHSDSYASFTISRGVSAIYDQTIISDAMKNKSEVSFSLDKQNKKLWIYLDAQIYANRVFKKGDYSSEIDSIPDVLFVKGRYQFNY